MEKQKRQSRVVVERMTLFTHCIVFLLGSGFGATCALLWYAPSNTITTIVTLATLLGLVVLFLTLFMLRHKSK